MGLWGAAQAIAFGLGGLLGAVASDVARWLISAPGPAYASVFAAEGLLFLVAARLAWRVTVPGPAETAAPDESKSDSDGACAPGAANRPATVPSRAAGAHSPDLGAAA